MEKTFQRQRRFFIDRGPNTEEWAKLGSDSDTTIVPVKKKGKAVFLL